MVLYESINRFAAGSTISYRPLMLIKQQSFTGWAGRLVRMGPEVFFWIILPSTFPELGSEGAAVEVEAAEGATAP